MGGLIKIIFSLTINAILNLDEGVLELLQQQELILDLVDCARVDSLGHQFIIRMMRATKARNSILMALQAFPRTLA